MKKSIDKTLKEDALLNEIATDLKNEQLQNLWNKYGLFIIIFVAAALTIAVCFESIKAWSEKRDQEMSNAYAVAVSLHSQGRSDESLNILQTLANNRRGVYSDIARLQIANIYMEQNKTDEAIKIWQALADDRHSVDEMRAIATLKLASAKMDTQAAGDEIKSLLEPLTQDDNQWANSARGLLAELAIRDGNLEEARRQYELIINAPNVPDNLKNLAQDMVIVIDEDSK